MRKKISCASWTFIWCIFLPFHGNLSRLPTVWFHSEYNSFIQQEWFINSYHLLNCNRSFPSFIWFLLRSNSKRNMWQHCRYHCRYCMSTFRLQLQINTFFSEFEVQSIQFRANKYVNNTRRFLLVSWKWKKIRKKRPNYHLFILIFHFLFACIYLRRFHCLLFEKNKTLYFDLFVDGNSVTWDWLRQI